MKVRNSFVTNSSSSSFVVAIKQGVTKDDLVKDLFKIYSKDKQNFDSCISEYIEELEETGIKYLSSEEIELVQKSKNKDETLLNSIFYEMIDWLSSELNSKLDSWEIGVAECSNEDGGMSSLMYDLWYSIKGEYIKLLS